jgi:hypothetical protein
MFKDRGSMKSHMQINFIIIWNNLVSWTCDNGPIIFIIIIQFNILMEIAQYIGVIQLTLKVHHNIKDF